MKACIIITNGFEEVETLSPFGILSRGGVDVDIYSLIDQDVTGRSGATLTNLLPLSQFDDTPYDALILPGGPQWHDIEASPKVQAIIKQFIDTDRYICAICAAPTILGRQGYLKGKNYTCFTNLNGDFGGYYQEKYAVTDGKIITSCSAASSIEFGFAILEALLGKEEADKTKASVYYNYKNH